jgi:predicted amidohydrolase YtcJ
MLSIYAAVIRQDQTGQPAAGWYPEERISVAEAIYGFTLGSAYAAGREHHQGSIAAGKWADMIMLSQNIFECPGEAIRDTEVALTIFDGQIVHYPEGEVDSIRRTVMFAPILGSKF